MLPPIPIKQIPADYHEVEHFILTEPRLLIKLNVFSLGLMVVGFGVMIGWAALAQALRPDEIVCAGICSDIPVWLGFVLLIVVLPLHEWIHGLTIRWMKHKPRYGIINAKINRFIQIPMALYATADGAYFPRNQFIVIALAPLIVITLLGMLLILLTPGSMVFYIVIGAALNIGGAIGDVWMTVIVLRYPPTALVQDEADSIRVFTVDSPNSRNFDEKPHS
jgi:hypothetical protein